ncbi:ankyrin repeat-containing domain protein [Mycena sanguinolenta]|nr:ankyrin repeat-containing domain protein [Mycena sanguinolenta]
MSKSYFQDFPPELVLLLFPLLTTATLNALALTCRRLHEILQPELESLITPELGRELLLWAAKSRPVIVAKLLSPPHSVDPAQSFWGRNALHIAVNAGNAEIVGLLLNAGANAASEDSHFGLPILLAAHNNDLETMKLLLNHGAPIDAKLGSDETALHSACWMGHLEMAELLLERGANIECSGHYGNALGFAVARRNPAMVKLLLDKGADATVTVPLSRHRYNLPPHNASLLYDAMGLWRPSKRNRWARQNSPERWQAVPLSDKTRELMGLLLAHGASKETTMATISEHLTALANEAQYTEQEFLDAIAAMFKEAEDAIPDLSRKWR